MNHWLSAQVIWTIRRTWGLRGEWLYICTFCGWWWSYFCTISDQLSLPCFVACYINPYLLGTFGESTRSLFVSVRLHSGANALKEATVQPVLQAKRVCQDSGPPIVIYQISWIHTSIMDPLELSAISRCPYFFDRVSFPVSSRHLTRFASTWDAWKNRSHWAESKTSRIDIPIGDEGFTIWNDWKPDI